MNILYIENHAVFAEQVTRQFLAAHRVTIVPTLSLAMLYRVTKNYLTIPEIRLDSTDTELP